MNLNVFFFMPLLMKTGWRGCVFKIFKFKSCQVRLGA